MGLIESSKSDGCKNDATALATDDAHGGTDNRVLAAEKNTELITSSFT
jgi:hypothetical protein